MAAILGVAAPADAHTQRPLRSVTVQVEPGGVIALWRAELGGATANLLRSRHDRDRDGRLDHTEQMQLAAAVMAKAMGGVRIEIDGRRPELADLDARVERATGGTRLVVLALATLRVPGTLDPRRRVLRLVLEHGEPLVVGAQGLDGWRLRETSRGAVAPRGALGEPVTLAREEGVILTFERTGEPEE